MRSLAFIVSTLVLLPTTAALAQNQHHVDQPTFATLDRQGTSSTFSADLSLTTFDSDFFDFKTGGLTLHGSYFFAPNVAGYATLPLTHAFVEDADDESALGNIELGTVFAPTPRGPVRFLARAGFALPTADDDSASVFGAFTRVTDLVLFVPDIAALRLSGSALGSSGQIFWRADAGLDVPFDTSDDAADLDPLIRINLGAGVQTRSVALMGEIASVGTTGETEENEDRFLYTAGFSARFNGSRGVQPMVAIATPLSNDLQNFVDFSFFVGLSSAIGPR